MEQTEELLAWPQQHTNLSIICFDRKNNSGCKYSWNTQWAEQNTSMQTNGTAVFGNWLLHRRGCTDAVCLGFSEVFNRVMHDKLLGEIQTRTVQGEMTALDRRGKLGDINWVPLFWDTPVWFQSAQGEHLPNQQELTLLHNTLLKPQLKDCSEERWKHGQNREELLGWLRGCRALPPRGCWPCLVWLYVDGEVGLVYIKGFILVTEGEEERGAVTQTELAQKRMSVTWTWVA